MKINTNTKILLYVYEIKILQWILSKASILQQEFIKSIIMT